MQWIKYLEEKNIPFKVQIIESNDSIIFHTLSKNEYLFFLLDGFLKLLQVFTNGENICKALLYKDHLMTSLYNASERKTNYYYKATAITKTAIAIVSIQTLEQYQLNLVLSIAKLAMIDKHRNENSMICILSNRNTKKRVVQLLLILAKRFGEYNECKITIPFHISHQTISLIVGSNRTHVSRIMNNLKKLNIISYNKQQIIIKSILNLIQI